MEISDANRDESERIVIRKLCTGKYVMENYHVPQRSTSFYNTLKTIFQVGAFVALTAGAIAGSHWLGLNRDDPYSQAQEQHIQERFNTKGIEAEIQAETVMPEDE